MPTGNKEILNRRQALKLGAGGLASLALGFLTGNNSRPSRPDTTTLLPLARAKSPDYQSLTADAYNVVVDKTNLITSPDQISETLGFGLSVQHDPLTPYSLIGINSEPSSKLLEALNGSFKGKSVVVKIQPQLTDAAIQLPVDNGLLYHDDETGKDIIEIRVVTDEDSTVNRLPPDIEVLQGYVERRLGQVLTNELLSTTYGPESEIPNLGEEPVFVFQHQKTS